MTQDTAARARLLENTSHIVAAYAGNNAIPNAELPRLIATVFNTVSGLGAAPEPAQEPAVPVSRSVTRTAILCLECGKPHKMLKRHLANAHGLSPDDYRRKWGLEPTYPMTSPAYSVLRRKLAENIGLGRA